MSKKLPSLLLVFVLLCSCVLNTFIIGAAAKTPVATTVEQSEETPVNEKTVIPTKKEIATAPAADKTTPYCDIAAAITSTEIEKTVTEPGEVFSVTVTLNGQYLADSFTYEEAGFAVAAPPQQEGNVISFALAATGEEPKPTFLLHITLQDGSTVSPGVYGFVNEYGAFLSKSSYDDAWSVHLEYLLEEEIITEEEADELYNEHALEGVNVTTYREENTAPLTRAGADTWVSGQLRWQDDAGIWHPLQYAAVTVYDDDVAFEDLLGETATDENGNFFVGFTNQTDSAENGGCDPYIVVYCMDGDLTVVVDRRAGSGYSVESPHVNGNVSTGSTTYINMDFTMDNDLGRAFQIMQAAATMTRYVSIITSPIDLDLGFVRILYPDSGDGCYYSNGNIFITAAPAVNNRPESYAAWDVITHEYGHHIQYLLGITDSPGGGHFVNDSMTEHYAGTIHGTCGCIQPGAAQAKYEGIRLAWGEAWNTVLGIRSQQFFSNILQNIATVGDSSYTSYNNVNYNLESGSYAKLGEGCESTLTYVLYDLCDPSNESYDDIDLGDKEFFSISRSSHAVTFSEFINFCYSKVNRFALGRLLSEHQIAPYSFRTTTTGLSLTPPTFTWERGNETGQNNYRNDRFEVAFFSSTGVEIFRCAPVTVSGNATPSYTPTQSEWDRILMDYGTKIYVGVYGYQTANPQTGPYLSAINEYDKPAFDPLTQTISVSASTRLLERTVTLRPGQYIDYHVTFAKAGTQLFQTFGGGNTVLYLYDAQGEMLASNDDDGAYFNGMIQYTVEANTTYIVRVKFDTPGSSGDTKFTIMPYSTPVDTYENYGGAASYENSTVSGSTSAGSVFMRRYILNTADVGSFTFTTNSSTDMYLYLIDPLSTERCMSNGNGAGKGKAKITALLERNRYYLVIVVPYNVQSGSSFTLSCVPTTTTVSSAERTIEDNGDMGNPYCSISYKSLTGHTIAEIEEMGYTQMTLTITLDAKEVNDGYQYIALYDGVSTSAKQFGNQRFEHGSGTTDTNYWSHSFTFTINLSDITNSILCLRFNASGFGSDTWLCKNVRIKYDLYIVF